VDTNDEQYAGSQTIQYTILPRPLILKALDAEMTAGEAEPELTYHVEGLLDGDSLHAKPTLSWDSSKQKIAGKYLISIKLDNGTVSENYSPVLIPGTMTVKTGALDTSVAPSEASSANDNEKDDASYASASGSGGGSDRDSDRSSGRSGSGTNAATVAASDSDTDTTKEPWRFVDVPDGHWAAEAVYLLADRGLVTGTSATHFSPDDHMTRQMLMTVLARANGVDTTGDPYTRGMSWAVQSGVSDGSDPTAQLTREQLATMLWRSAGRPDPTEDTLDDFTDAHEISDYAKQAVQWAYENGIMQGKGDGILDPKGWATRAEVAQMLARLLG
jgi:hypothetical protein